MKRLIMTMVAMTMLFCSFVAVKAEFVPKNRVPGIGAQRTEITPEVLQERTKKMMEAQTFVIIRDPEALAGAKRITGPQLQKLFGKTSQESGFSKAALEAICYIESWGKLDAASPTGPKGIMQISRGTAKEMGLNTRKLIKVEYRNVKVKIKGRYRWVKRPFRTYLDERLIPEKAIPAAAKYLRKLEVEFGRQDLAVFAYHCGKNGVKEIVGISSRQSPSVVELFFLCHPAYNPNLYAVIQKHMSRDYSPTYWFRVQRAQELLALYRQNPKVFEALFRENQNRIEPKEKAPSRLWVWMSKSDLKFQTSGDLAKKENGLVEVFNKPGKFGFELRKKGPGCIGEKDIKNQKLYLQATKEAVGAITYISFETKKLMGAMKAKFTPLEITSLVRTLAYQRQLAGDNKNAETKFPSHCSGRVFDISYKDLTLTEHRALRLVLNDLEWTGMIDFTTESVIKTYHIGISPTAQEFFTAVYEEAR